MRYFVGIEIDGPTGFCLATWQQRLGPARWHITTPPHITLVPPGAAKLGVAEAAGEFTAMQLPLSEQTITLGSIGTFGRRHRRTLYVRPEPTIWLKHMAATLIELAPAWQQVRHEARPFVPHVTLANQLTPREADTAAPQLPPSLELSYSVRRLTLFAKPPDSPMWQIAAQYPLARK